jgi:hypothetical protein
MSHTILKTPELSINRRLSVRQLLSAAVLRGSGFLVPRVPTVARYQLLFHQREWPVVGFYGRRRENSGVDCCGLSQNAFGCFLFATHSLDDSPHFFIRDLRFIRISARLL